MDARFNLSLGFYNFPHLSGADIQKYSNGEIPKKDLKDVSVLEGRLELNGLQANGQRTITPVAAVDLHLPNFKFSSFVYKEVNIKEATKQIMDNIWGSDAYVYFIPLDNHKTIL